MYLRCCQSGGGKEFSVKDGTATVQVAIGMVQREGTSRR